MRFKVNYFIALKNCYVTGGAPLCLWVMVLLNTQIHTQICIVLTHNNKDMCMLKRVRRRQKYKNINRDMYLMKQWFIFLILHHN